MSLSVALVQVQIICGGYGVYNGTFSGLDNFGQN